MSVEVRGTEEVYLDWNAAAPPHPDVERAMSEARRDGWANPASVHAAGRRARALVEDARETVAARLGVEARDVVFTSGGTEANNLALHRAPALVTSRIEHPSVVRVAEQLEARGVPVVWLPVPESGRIEPGDVEQALSGLPPGAFVALMAVNHETGVLQPLAEVFDITTRARAHLHVDAVQAIGRLPPEAYAHGDSFVVASHKIRGPKGIGALAFRPGKGPRPLVVGGAQERGLRPGTVDAVAAAGFRAALERVPDSAERYRELGVLRDELERALADSSERNGAGPRAFHVTNLSVRGLRGDELVAMLDLEGVRISSGSACSAGTTEPSSVISAMLGRSRAERAVRLSLGEETRGDQIEYAIRAWNRVLGPRPSRPSSDG
jgi:cysteine desulfurase